MDAPKLIRRRSTRAAIRNIWPLVLVLAAVAYGGRRGPLEYLALVCAVEVAVVGLRVSYTDGYRDAVDHAKAVIGETTSPLDAALAEALAAAEEAEQAVRAGAPLDDPRVIRARALIHRVDELTGRGLNQRAL